MQNFKINDYRTPVGIAKQLVRGSGGSFEGGQRISKIWKTHTLIL
jgi:hypothetical protein